MTNFKSKLAAGLVKNELKELKNMMDYTEYGGAGLFGINSPVIKAHGSSNANALYNAVRQAREMASHQVTQIIKDTIKKENK